MKKTALSILAFSSALLATAEVSSLTEVFSEAKTSGNVKYYFIQTDKNVAGGADTSANANSLGGELHFDTASLYGFSAKITSVTGGKEISVNAVGAKAVVAFGGSKFVLACSKVFKDENKRLFSSSMGWNTTLHKYDYIK